MTNRFVDDRSFDELRTGFTAAVSHELRTPLARIMVLLDSADLPDADVHALIDQARAEVENAGELIDEILFLSELESGKEVVSLGWTNALPVLEHVVAALDGAAMRAGVDAETLGRLFERFYRGDEARTTRGTGLGLAIVKHVVTAAGGEVEATGVHRRGLQIRCTFPVQARRREA